MNRSGDSGLFRSKIMGAVSKFGQSKLGRPPLARYRQISTIGILIGILLILLTVLVAWIVNASMQELTRNSLRTILAANTTSLEMWLSETRDIARVQLELDDLAQAARNLIAEHAKSPTWSPQMLDANADYLTLNQIDYVSFLGWALLDLQGNVVASNDQGLVARVLPISEDVLKKLLASEATVSRPFRLPIAIPGRTDHFSIPGGPVMCSMAPIGKGTRTSGALCLLIDPLDRFTELLSIARMGQSGETYAFDRFGLLLSQSRFESQFRAAGLLDSNPAVVSPLNIPIRDPGVNVTAVSQVSIDHASQPLTLMADQATRGATGDNVLGYNNYRGVPVAGAWRWLSEYGIGIATEIDIAEAYRPVSLLRRAMYALAGLVLLCGIALLMTGIAYRRLGRDFNVTARQRLQLGKYELGEVIGRGGMGAVYRGRHQLLRRDVAIKVLSDDIELTQQVVARFEREVQLTAQLQHPNTIDIYDYGHTEDGTFFYVMEYVDGITLQELVDEYGRQPPQRVIHLLLQICGSLSEAHQLGMIHRDIKPSNILVTARAGVYDVVKVLDFGLVKQKQDRSAGADSSLTLTKIDGITGTPMYMSPESVRDASTADERSDLYSVGAVGYILLTGQSLFDSESSVDACLKQLNDIPIRPSQRIGSPLPEDLQNVVMSCLRKSPEERPMSAEDLADSLRHCQDANRWTTADAIKWWEVGAN